MNRLRLHRDPIARADASAVLALPPWLKPDPGSWGAYWHQPRSASFDGTVLSVTLWCGQHRFVHYEGLFADEAPPERACGTCAGRREGYDRERGRVFSPRDHFGQPPRLCPVLELEPGQCVCGRRLRMSWGYSTSYSRHPTGPALVKRAKPCPRHGWSRIQTRGRYPAEAIVCGDFQCGWVMFAADGEAPQAQRP